ncbi:MAG: NAD(P)-dependent oxidoreductase [Syntrophobacteraceae bacterium]
MSEKKTIMLTGGSGFVGQMLQVGLRQRGYGVRVFDQYRGTAINLLRRRYLGSSRSWVGQAAARQIGKVQRKISIRLLGGPLLRPTRDNILDLRNMLAARFRGAYAVVHLAGIPHPFQPGAIDADFQRINYDGSVNVFEAAKSIGVTKFLFASSGQVYGINNPTRIDQFPILESNYCPTLAEGQHMYGLLKVKFEQYLAGACADGGTQGISLRLEYPGFQSDTPGNFYVSTSVENLVSGVVCALENSADFQFETFNLVDDHVDEKIVDVQQFIRTRWPTVPNFSKGNESLISVAKAGELLGYNPIRDGSYIQQSLVW